METLMEPNYEWAYLFTKESLLEISVLEMKNNH